MTQDSKDNQGPVSAFENKLREQSTKLKALVDEGDLSGALGVISEINESRDRTLYQEVGHLTRTLYESIKNFHIDSNLPEDPESVSKMNDASDRLTYVVEMTNKAANKTLDLVEETMPFASGIKDEAVQLKEAWGRLQRKEMKPEEFRALSGRMDEFLGKLSEDSDKVYKNLSEILLAQDFQDLTGQVIHRVTGLVKEVEENLVNLVRMAGKVDAITGTVHDIEEEDKTMQGEGPQMNADKREDVVSGQDDVDDLLSSLGF
jgi:chemotaxis protein CheZ